MICPNPFDSQMRTQVIAVVYDLFPFLFRDISFQPPEPCR